MQKKIVLAVAILIAGISVSACHDGRPGHDSDRPRHHHHDQDRDGVHN